MNEYKSKIIILVIAWCLIISIVPLKSFYNDLKKNKEVKELEKQEKIEDSKKTGEAYNYYGDSQKAAEQYQAAAELSSYDRDLLYRLVSAQTNANQVEEAEKTFAKLERTEKNSADFWNARAVNIHKKPDSLKNIELAVKYLEKSYELAKYKEAPMFLESRASIYLEEYKYYRNRRKYNEQPKKQEEIAKQKFLNAMEDFRQITKKDYFLVESYTDLYNRYNAIAKGVKYKSVFEDRPELDKIPYTEADIERAKTHVGERNYPKKQ